MIGEVLTLELSPERPTIDFLKEVIATGATDIHLDISSRDVRARIRVNGALEAFAFFERESFIVKKSIFRNIQKIAGIPSGSMTPATGKIKIFEGEGLLFRVSSIPLNSSLSKLNLRIQRGNLITSFDKLGYPAQFITEMRHVLSFAKSGLIILSGATGSGKSTALSAAISELAFGDKAIYTIEDPIEYLVDGIYQIEVNEHFTFKNALRELLRQDPDIFIIGEIRDNEVAQSAIEFARSGHLVITTIHANSIDGIQKRLLDLGVDADDYNELIKISAHLEKVEGTNIPLLKWSKR